MSIMSIILNILPLILGIIFSVFILNRMRMITTHEMGGIALFPIFLMALCLTMGISSWLTYFELLDIELGISGDRILQVFTGCSLLYIVGLKTDFHGTWAHTKFFILMAAAAMFPLSGLWIRDLQGLCGIHEISAWIGIPLTMILTMFITESIALLDDIDGIGMVVTTIMLSVLLGFSMAYGFTLGMLITSAELGVSVPYCIYKKFHPSWKNTLIGYAGTYPMGYVLSYATLSLLHPAGIDMPAGTLMIVLGIILVPMFDLLRTLHQRIKDGRALLTPDRNFLQHQLIRMGVPKSFTIICIIGLILLFATLNSLWVLHNGNLTVLAIIDAAAWMLLQVGINFTIHHRETSSHQKAWDMTYGREVWEADTPVEIIRQKQEFFGSMGIAERYIPDDETKFIPDGMTSLERQVKRTIDCMVAFVMLILCSPLFLLCSILIRWEDHGPVIYSQERIGRFGKPFSIYKFRSMRTDAEKDGPELSHASGEDDPRLTRVGRFLRAHHLDELPQLWNVLKGDMSFIGYRPERQYYIDQIMEHDPRYAMLYQIRPGVTSYATLYNGYTDTMEKMLRRLTYDLYYLEHRSFGFDMKILWDTFISIVFGKKF